MKIVVIGGGASGLVAAIEAAKRGATVCVLEKMNKPAKKILVTGNGKCNLTNQIQEITCYRSEQAELAFSVIQQLGYDFTLQYFQELGIVTVNKNSYEYPASGQAETVAKALISKALSLGIVLDMNCQVSKIERKQTGFRITYRNTETKQLQTVRCDKVILAAGGKTAPKQGSDGSGLMLAQSLGHRIISPMPSLVALRSNLKYLKHLSGVRVAAAMRLMIDHRETAEERGELQITAYGLSGVAIFQMSRYAVDALSKGKKVAVYVDLLPQYTLEEFGNLLLRIIQNCAYKTIEEVLDGLMNWKLAHTLLKEMNIQPDMPCGRCSRKQLQTIVSGYKQWIVPIVGNNDFEQAQVTQGGVDLKEINMLTMESKLVSDLYFAGEILDVDGACGGYNLQWAWSSGYIAGSESAGDRS